MHGYQIKAKSMNKEQRSKEILEDTQQTVKVKGRKKMAPATQIKEAEPSSQLEVPGGLKARSIGNTSFSTLNLL